MTDFPGSKMSSKSEHHSIERYKSKKSGSGTIVSAMLLDLGFTLGSDARIVDLDDDRSNILYLFLLFSINPVLFFSFVSLLICAFCTIFFIYFLVIQDQLKIQTIHKSPPILGLLCGDFEAAENLVELLKSKANNASIEELVQCGKSFLEQHRSRHAFTTYMCYVKERVPNGYIFYFVPYFNHVNKCEEDYTCKCPMVGIRHGARELEHGSIYNDGSGASDAQEHLSMSFFDGKMVQHVDAADDYQIANIKKKLKISLIQARMITRLAMIHSCLKDNNCGAPFRGN